MLESDFRLSILFQDDIFTVFTDLLSLTFQFSISLRDCFCESEKCSLPAYIHIEFFENGQ